MGRDEVFTEPSNCRGENVPEAMVLFHRDDIKSGDIGRIRITDTAPTILH